MKTKNKALLLSLCAVLLVAASVLGTLAYLTDSETVTNTFAVGKVGLKLDEAKVTLDGNWATDHSQRTDANTYHLLPGHTYYKDPTVTVDAGSEDAYVRMIVKVENIDQLVRALPLEETVTDENGVSKEVEYPENAKYYSADGTFLLQMLCVDENGTCTWDANTWKMYDYTESDDYTDGYYEFRYKEIVKKSETETELLDLFTHITVPGEIDNDHLAYLEDVKIVVTAHAIQADGFDDAGEAWETFSE